MCEQGGVFSEPISFSPFYRALTYSYLQPRKLLSLTKENNVGILCDQHYTNLEGINYVHHASLLYIIDEAMKRYIKLHHVHIGSLPAYL